MERQRNDPVSSVVVPAGRNTQQEVVQSRSRQSSQQFDYHHHRHSQIAQAPPQQVEELTVPVMLCHTCSHCGQMRSAGFHRNNPVVPGKPLVPTLCRRCEKKLKSSNRSSSRYTRIRKCMADEPCEWPREPFQVDIDHDERRGRRRSREEVYVDSYSSARPRVVRRNSSQGRLGLRVVQKPLQEYKTERTIRTSTLSPRPSSRYADVVWPPPDIVRMRATQSDEIYSAPPEPLPIRTSRSDEVWPPPDVVRTHSYRKIERSPLRRQSSRIIELSPSPPPPRPRSTRVVYRSDSQERRTRSRSVSATRVRFREERRSEEAEARLMSHPRPFRPVIPDERPLFRASDETSSNTDSMPRHRPESPGRSILKSASADDETSCRRRDSMRESQQSMHVEVGGPRVHFGGGRREEVPVLESRGRARYVDERTHSEGNSGHYKDYSRRRIVEDVPPAPPTQDFGRIRIRHSSPSPRRDYEDEIRIDRQRRISPSPPMPRRFEDVRTRYTSPPPSRHTPHPPRSLSPSSPHYPPPPLYRHVPRPRARSITPPPSLSSRRKEEADHTDSDSVHSGEITEVRSWKGIDENGRPATFVEERRSVGLIEQGSERGGGLAREYRELGRGGERERLAVGRRRWRDD